jgi:hypothetical protein
MDPAQVALSPAISAEDDGACEGRAREAKSGEVCPKEAELNC